TVPASTKSTPALVHTRRLPCAQRAAYPLRSSSSNFSPPHSRSRHRMRRFDSRMVVLSLALAASCARQPVASPAPSPSAGTGTAQTPAPSSGAPGADANAVTPRPRRAPPNPVVQDSIRRATVATLLVEIAGKENQPAGTVFKNVQLLKDVPAGEF